MNRSEKYFRCDFVIVWDVENFIKLVCIDYCFCCICDNFMRGKGIVYIDMFYCNVVIYINCIKFKWDIVSFFNSFFSYIC